MTAVSVNNAYYNNRSYGFKPDVKEWYSQIGHLLGQGDNLKAINDIKAHFNSSKHVFHVMLTFNNPNYYTKSGTMSARSFDVSNIEKIFLDALFLPAHTNSLNIDDKFVTRMISEKRYADEFSIDVVVHVKNAPKRPE